MTDQEMAELTILVHMDARKRMDSRALAECVGKHRFESYRQAQETIGPKLRHLTNVYHCAQCKTYHVGNRIGNRIRRLFGGRRRL